MGDFIYKHMGALKIILMGVFLIAAAVVLKETEQELRNPLSPPSKITDIQCTALSSSPESSILVVIYSDGSVRTAEVPTSVCEELFD